VLNPASLQYPATAEAVKQMKLSLSDLTQDTIYTPKTSVTYNYCCSREWGP